MKYIFYFFALSLFLPLTHCFQFEYPADLSLSGKYLDGSKYYSLRSIDQENNSVILNINFSDSEKLPIKVNPILPIVSSIKKINIEELSCSFKKDVRPDGITQLLYINKDKKDLFIIGDEVPPISFLFKDYEIKLNKDNHKSHLVFIKQGEKIFAEYGKTVGLILNNVSWQFTLCHIKKYSEPKNLMIEISKETPDFTFDFFMTLDRSL